MFRPGDIVAHKSYALSDEKIKDCLFKVLTCRRVRNSYGLPRDLITIKPYREEVEVPAEPGIPGAPVAVPWGTPDSLYRDEDAAEFQIIKKCQMGHPFTKVFAD